jgi:serine/threonine protein kinase
MAPQDNPVISCAACGAEMDANSPVCFNCGHARQSALLKKGEVIADRYELTSVLGRGGMGMVYEAHDRSLDERVALKVLSEAARGSSDADRRFRDEIRLARKIRHPNVCGIHEYGKVQDLQYIVMEFIDGQDLKKYMRSRGRLNTEEALDIARQIGEGLQAIHDAGVIHRDLKLSNVMRDNTGRLRLMDFGIAKVMGDTTATATGHIIGTPEYMSPEQVQGFHLDPRSDLYSLGVMTYELLTGRVPFRADTPLATIMLQVHEPPRLDDPTIPPQIVPVLRKALQKDPEDRYESVRAFVTALTGAAVSIASSRAPVPRPATSTGSATVDLAALRPASPPQPDRRPTAVKASKPARPLTSSELRFGLWMGASAAVLLGFVVTLWLTLRPAEPGPGPAEPATQSSSNQLSTASAPGPLTAPAEPTTPSPLGIPAGTETPGTAPSARVVSSPTRSAASEASSTSRPRTPPAPVAARAGSSTLSRPTTPGTASIVPVPPAPTIASTPARTPLPTAVLTTLPSATPIPQAASTPLQAPTPAVTAATENSRPPTPGVGYLQLGAKPYALVIVDGKEVGTLPMRALELTEGKHVVRFLHPDYQPLQRVVTIRKGEGTKLFVDFTLDGIAK